MALTNTAQSFTYRGFRCAVHSGARNTLITVSEPRYFNAFELVKQHSHVAAMAAAYRYIDGLIAKRRQAHRTRLQLISSTPTNPPLHSLVSRVTFAELSAVRQQRWAARLAAHASTSSAVSVWLLALDKLPNTLPITTWQNLTQLAYQQNMQKLGKNPGLRPLVKYPAVRHTHCYACRRSIDNLRFYQCTDCRWIICLCGACGCGFA